MRLLSRLASNEAFQGLMLVGALMGCLSLVTCLVVAGLGGGAWWVGAGLVIFLSGMTPALGWLAIVIAERRPWSLHPDALDDVERGEVAWRGLPSILREDTTDLVEDLRHAARIANNDRENPYLLDRVRLRADHLEAVQRASQRMDAGLWGDAGIVAARDAVRALDEVSAEMTAGR